MKDRYEKRISELEAENKKALADLGSAKKAKMDPQPSSGGVEKDTLNTEVCLG